MIPEKLPQRIEQFKAGLARKGIKLTHQRLEIFREVTSSTEHPDVETVFRAVRERVPTVSLDTVYRTLWLLHDLGLVTAMGHPHGRVRFDANQQVHHHFVCTVCGLTRDFYCDAFDQLQIPDSVRSLGRIERAQVEVRGVCRRCADDPVTKSAPGAKKEAL